MDEMLYTDTCIMTRFASLRSKVYCYKVEGVKKTCKKIERREKGGTSEADLLRRLQKVYYDVHQQIHKHADHQEPSTSPLQCEAE